MDSAQGHLVLRGRWPGADESLSHARRRHRGVRARRRPRRQLDGPRTRSHVESRAAEDRDLERAVRRRNSEATRRGRRAGRLAHRKGGSLQQGKCDLDRPHRRFEGSFPAVLREGFEQLTCLVAGREQARVRVVARRSLVHHHLHRSVHAPPLHRAFHHARWKSALVARRQARRVHTRCGRRRCAEDSPRAASQSVLDLDRRRLQRERAADLAEPEHAARLVPHHRGTCESALGSRRSHRLPRRPRWLAAPLFGGGVGW